MSIDREESILWMWPWVINSKYLCYSFLRLVTVSLAKTHTAKQICLFFMLTFAEGRHEPF